MNFIKKSLLALSLVGALGASATASAVTITDVYDPTDVYLTSNGPAYNFAHNIASVLNGFVVGVDSLLSASLDLFFRDDKAGDGNEVYKVQIGLQQVFTDNDLQDSWTWVVFPFWGTSTPGSITENVNLTQVSLNDLGADGIINMSVRSTSGDFYFEKSVLNAEVKRGTPVPEPATLAMLGIGLLGFAATRRKAAKGANA